MSRDAGRLDHTIHTHGKQSLAAAVSKHVDVGGWKGLSIVVPNPVSRL